MSDLEKFWDAVTEIRAAQKLEWAALPSNLGVWKRARQKQTVALLEEKVDRLADELLRSYDWSRNIEKDSASTGGNKESQSPGSSEP